MTELCSSSEFGVIRLWLMFLDLTLQIWICLRCSAREGNSGMGIVVRCPSFSSAYPSTRFWCPSSKKAWTSPVGRVQLSPRGLLARSLYFLHVQGHIPGWGRTSTSWSPCPPCGWCLGLFVFVVFPLVLSVKLSMPGWPTCYPFV